LTKNINYNFKKLGKQVQFYSSYWMLGVIFSKKKKEEEKDDCYGDICIVVPKTKYAPTSKVLWINLLKWAFHWNYSGYIYI